MTANRPCSAKSGSFSSSPLKITSSSTEHREVEIPKHDVCTLSESQTYPNRFSIQKSTGGMYGQSEKCPIRFPSRRQAPCGNAVSLEFEWLGTYDMQKPQCSNCTSPTYSAQRGCNWNCVSSGPLRMPREPAARHVQESHANPWLRLVLEADVMRHLGDP